MRCCNLVARRLSEGRVRESYTTVGRVENGVEALQERLSVDEVEALARGSANRTNDEVDVVSIASDRGVESTLKAPGIQEWVCH